MRHRPPFVLAALAAAALLVPAAGRAHGSPQPDDAPVTTVATDDPFGLPELDPIDGGAPIPDASVEVVHRWAIAPQGANAANDPSTRSELAYTGEPGSVIEDGVTVFNLGNAVLTFRVYATDAVNTPDGTFSLLPRTEQPTDVGTWVTVAQEHVTIAPGMAATIPITISVPDGATPGDHVGAVVASSPTSGEADDGSRVELDRGIGTRIYLRVPGELRPELAVEGLTVDYGGAFNPLGGTATVTYRIHNRGNVRIDGSYRAWVAGPLGIGRETADPVEFSELLPGQSIEATTEFAGVAALGWANGGVDVEAAGAGGADAGDAASATTAALPVTVLLVALLAVTGAFAMKRIRRNRAPAIQVVEFAPADAIGAESVDAGDAREPQLS